MFKPYARVLAVSALIALGLLSCGKSPSSSNQATTTKSPYNIPGADVTAPTQSAPAKTKTYSSPKQIPTQSKGKDYTGGALPQGVCDIFAVQGRLFFSYITRWQGDANTQETIEWYTLFEYLPTGKVQQRSAEVNFITLVGNRFYYSRAGLPASSRGIWQAPWFSNNADWSSEQAHTGQEARALQNPPGRAVIQGKEQAYTTTRSADQITITLPESAGQTLTLSIDPVRFLGKSFAGFRAELCGIAQGKAYVSVAGAQGQGSYQKALFALDLTTGAAQAVQQGGQAIWVDPLTPANSSTLLGVVPQGATTQFVQVDLTTGQVATLAKINGAAYHFVVGAKHLLYEVPEDRPNSGGRELKHIPIQSQQ